MAERNLKTRSVIHITGKVIAINKTEKTATINHDEIPGYMESMTMEFKVKNDSDLDKMKPGDRISGDLVVTDTSSWIEIMAITQGGAELTPTTIVPGEPKPGDEIPDFTLVNQDGKPIRLSQYKGKWRRADICLHALPATGPVHFDEHQLRGDREGVATARGRLREDAPAVDYLRS